MAKNVKNPLVSVIVPIFNAEKFLKRTISSVKCQTYDNWELILVDDCSTDNSLKLINESAKLDERIKVVGLKENSGPAKTRNAGIEAAKGDFIAFLDADDVWLPEKLEKQLIFMKKHDSIFSFTGYEFADSEAKPNGTVVNIPKSIDYKHALKNTTIFTSTVMFDVSKISKEGIMMPDVKSEDTATWWKVLKQIEKADGLNESLSLYCRSQKTMSSNKLVAIKRIWHLYRNQEKLNLISSSINFVGYAFNAVRRRV